jgi:hypothetical protein
MEFMDQIQREFIDFLRRGYGDISSLNQAWQLRGRDQLSEFARAPYPSRRSQRYGRASEAYRADVDQFWQARGEEPAAGEEEEE